MSHKENTGRTFGAGLLTPPKRLTAGLLFDSARAITRRETCGPVPCGVRRPAHNDVADSWSAFRTAIGWWGIAGRGKVVRAVFVGHPSVVSVMQAAQQWAIESSPTGSLDEADWHPALRERLQAYAEGERVDFKDFKLELPERTPFRDKVLAATRRLGYGATTTYGDLARRVGHPGAARAVGTVMSTNRFPILIPCHRVLAAGGKLGGYTSPSGTDLKQRLLDMEQSTRSARVS